MPPWMSTLKSRATSGSNYHTDDIHGPQPINPRHYGDRTWLTEKQRKFAMVSPAQAAAIVACLEYKATQDEFQRPMIEQVIKQALQNY